MGVAALFVALTVVTATVYFSVESDIWLLPLAIGALLGGMLAVAGSYMLRGLAIKASLPQLFDLYKSLDNEKLRPVKIAVSLGSFEIGRDIGLVEFNNDQLRYVGLRTSFQFNRSSVLGSDMPLFGFPTEFRLGELDGEAFRVTIEPIKKLDPDNYYSIIGRYRSDLIQWLGAKTSGNLTEVMPPNRLAYREDAVEVPALAMFYFMLSLVLARQFDRLPEPYDNIEYLAYGVMLVIGLWNLRLAARRIAAFQKRFGLIAPSNANPNR